MPDLAALAGRLATAAGWRRRGWAFLFGAIATLAQPPLGAMPVLLLAVPGLLWLLDGAKRRRAAFGIGWWFGFGFFVTGLYWICFALLVDIAAFWWLMPVAICGLPAVLALFTGIVSQTLWLSGLRGLPRVIAFALLWTAAEWARGHFATGFPWLLVGYGWVSWPAVLQTAAVTGVYGLSLLTLLLAGLPALLGDPALPRRRARTALAAGFGLLALIAMAGIARLDSSDTGTVPGVRLRLVQANVQQSMKWDPRAREGNFQRHLALSLAPVGPGETAPTAVIWPETAITFFLAQDDRHRAAVGAAVPPGGLILTGAPRATLAEDRAVHFWNSLMAIDGAATLIGGYDKAHLVPFGEYLPGRAWLPSWVGTIAAGPSDFSAGPGPRTLHLAGLPPVSPLICYEAIFPGAVLDGADRPHWLLNLTNDAWYGLSAGPHQHFAITQTRAVEEGVPLVRVANTGISGVVDAYGRVTARLGLGLGGFLDVDLPRPLAAAPPYGRWGDGILLAMMLACGLLISLPRRPAPNSP
ncbi:MAG: apolipoprotein N-acyltransferase [Rhodospirillaceae bacterium]